MQCFWVCCIESDDFPCIPVWLFIPTIVHGVFDSIECWEEIKNLRAAPIQILLDRKKILLDRKNIPKISKNWQEIKLYIP